MDLVDEQHVAGVKIRQQRREITGFFDRRAGGDADIDAHLIRDNARECSFAQSRRAVEQNVVERFTALFRGFDKDLQVLLRLVLTDVFIKRLGS